MSDLEAPGARTQTAAPVTSLALGKLRAITSHRASLTQDHGLIDAFAEVFASMAQAQTVAPPTPVNNSESSRTVTDARRAIANEDPSNRSQFSHHDAQTDSEAEQTTLEVEGQAVAAVVDDQPHQERDPANEVKDVSNDAPSADQVTTDHADVAIVAVNQSVEDSYDSHAPEVVTPEAVENHDSGRRRRDRRDPAASQALAATPNGRLNTDQEFRESAPQVGTGESKVADPELALDPSLQQDVAESSDRLRGRSQGNLDAVQHDPRPVSQATQTRSQERPAATEVPTLIDSSVTAEKQQASAPSQQPVASNVESTITNIQNVAASAIRSGPQNVGHSGSQPTMRTLAIDGTPSEKSLPKPARDSRGKESNTAETLSRVKLIQRVSKAFQHLGPEGGVVRLRLAPAELGSVRVEMRVKHRQVEARVIAESEAASAALREHLPELRQRLESQGMQVERLEIESEQEESSFGRHSGHENRDSENGAEQWKDHRSGERRNTPRTRPSNSQSVSQLPRSPLTHGGVDVQL